MRADRRPINRSDLLFRVDAGASVGLGHVRRGHALAAELRREGVRSTFIVRNRGVGWAWLMARGETPHVLDGGADEARAVAREAARCRAPVIAIDVCEPIGQRYVMTLRRAGCAVAVLGNDGPGRLAADLSVSPVRPLEQSWRGALGDHVASPAYAVLGEPLRPSPRKATGVPTVLITMGGNDPDGITLTALAGVERIENPVRRILVVGPGFRLHGQLEGALARTANHYEVRYDVPEMAPLIATADVAVAAFGISAYELAAAGVPAVLVLRDRHERWHAERFSSAGAAVVVEQRPEAIVEALRPLVVGAALRQRFSQAAERLVDGRGTERVAEMLKQLARRRRRARRPGSRGDTAARATQSANRHGKQPIAARGKNTSAALPSHRSRVMDRKRGPSS